MRPLVVSGRLGAKPPGYLDALRDRGAHASPEWRWWWDMMDRADYKWLNPVHGRHGKSATGNGRELEWYQKLVPSATQNRGTRPGPLGYSFEAVQSFGDGYYWNTGASYTPVSDSAVWWVVLSIANAADAAYRVPFCHEQNVSTGFFWNYQQTLTGMEVWYGNGFVTDSTIDISDWVGTDPVCLLYVVRRNGDHLHINTNLRTGERRENTSASTRTMVARTPFKVGFGRYSNSGGCVGGRYYMGGMAYFDSPDKVPGINQLRRFSADPFGPFRRRIWLPNTNLTIPPVFNRIRMRFVG